MGTSIPLLTRVRTFLLKQPKGDRAFADLLLAARSSGLEPPPSQTILDGLEPDLPFLEERENNSIQTKLSLFGVKKAFLKFYHLPPLQP